MCDDEFSAFMMLMSGVLSCILDCIEYSVLTEYSVYIDGGTVYRTARGTWKSCRLLVHVRYTYIDI